jgi:hypothetical protein
MKYYYPKSLVILSMVIIAGSASVYPLYGYIYGESMFALMSSAKTDFWKSINFWCAMFFVLGVGGGICQFL